MLFSPSAIGVGVGSVPRGPAATLITMVMRGCPRAILTIQQVTVTGTGLLARLA
nr:MAG TPA: hypothetical protein [Caudoviricetes sp.]DAZ30919.1 MAG TPA: hypothetical protein [Caudoviricetes sp.]